MLKEIIKNLNTMTFRPLQNNKLILEANNLTIVKEKLVVIVINPFDLLYIFKDMSITIYYIIFNEVCS